MSATPPPELPPPPPSSLAKRLCRPRGAWAVAGLTLVGSLPTFDTWAPVANYMPLLMWLVYGLGPLVAVVLVRIGMLTVLAARYTHDGFSEALDWFIAALIAGGLALLGALGLPLWAGFLMSYPALERARTEIEADRPWSEARWVGIYPTYAGERTFGDDVVAVYTEGGTLFFRDAAIERPPYRGRLPYSGSGFFHLPEGHEKPRYNTGAEGRLLGGWYWFTTE